MFTCSTCAFQVNQNSKCKDIAVEVCRVLERLTLSRETRVGARRKRLCGTLEATAFCPFRVATIYFLSCVHVASGSDDITLTSVQPHTRCNVKSQREGENTMPPLEKKNAT